MSEYTPTTDEVRGDYAHFQTPGGTDPVTGEFSEGLAEFDRWLAKHDAEVERAAAEKAVGELLIELLPVLEEAVSNAYLCKNDRGVGGEWDDEIARAEAAVERAAVYRRNEGENE